MLSYGYYDSERQVSCFRVSETLVVGADMHFFSFSLILRMGWVMCKFEDLACESGFITPSWFMCYGILCIASEQSTFAIS